MLRQLVFVVLLSFAPLAAFAAELVNINSADARVLAQLKGIGPHKAAAIIAYRERNGVFRSVEELVRVKGIGQRTVELNRANLTTSQEQAAN